MELGALVILVLLALSLLAWIWLIVAGFRESTLWGVLAIFISPVAAVGLLVVNAKRHWAPALLNLVLSVVLTFAMFSYLVSTLGWVARSDWMQEIYLGMCDEATVVDELGISSAQCRTQVTQNWETCKAQLDLQLMDDTSLSGFEVMTLAMDQYNQCFFPR